MPERKLGEASPPVEFLAGPTGEEWQSDLTLGRRLAAYANHRHRAFAMADYIAGHSRTTQGRKLAHTVRSCGSFLEWRHYYRLGKSALRRAVTCKKHTLCPMCASLRGLRFAAAYRDRVELALRENPSLRVAMLTVTVKDGEDLRERFEHLSHSWKVLRQRWHRGNAATVWDRIEGAVWSFEVKRGAGSGLWHPHIHCLALVSGEITTAELAARWKEITGDSHVVDSRYVHADDAGAFCEVFKYALKFSELPLSDNWHAFLHLFGLRLVASAGCLRGIDPEDLMDPEESDPAFYDLLFQFSGQSYRHVATIPGGAGAGSTPHGPSGGPEAPTVD